MTKKSIRATIKVLNKTISASQKQAEAEQVTLQLCQIIRAEQPSVVAAFMPLADEIAIDVERLSTLCRIVVPRVTMSEGDKAEMEFFDYKLSEIDTGAYGISEPQGKTPCAAEDIDLIILPGVAFTRQGARIGRGKGFYDRYLARRGFRAKSVGVAFRHQILPDIPTEPHDRIIDMVVTAGEAL